VRKGLDVNGDLCGTESASVAFVGQATSIPLESFDRCSEVFPEMVPSESFVGMWAEIIRFLTQQLSQVFAARMVVLEVPVPAISQ
jgi:hypothetical protein